ncbi:hypothetical protein [Sorangium sp. So ce117]|uniref:hypothetical protein n=1 Tax=Sorangium sp. So ce117 TaxID=3133277 RepID=UPI003F63ED8A
MQFAVMAPGKPKAPEGDLATFQRERFTHDGVAHDVYRRGKGPAALVLTEMPGLSPHVLGFADRGVALGCAAVLPSLFGTAGRDPLRPRVAGALYAPSSMARACISKEFTVVETYGFRRDEIQGW